MDSLAERCFSQVDVQFLMNAVTDLMKKRVNETLSTFKDLVQKENMDVEEVFNLLQQENNTVDPFRGLRTQYSQIKFFKDNFDLIMPIKISLPMIPEDYGRHKTAKERIFRKQDYVYVPILPQLEKLLNIEDLYREINKIYIPSPCSYHRYEDGENYRNNRLFQRSPRALQIHLYLDEVQMCNPISSYNHKIVYVYFSLGNLPPKYRSTYKSVNLLALFYNEQVSFFDINLLLKPIIDDIKLLENGVKMTIKQKEV